MTVLLDTSVLIDHLRSVPAATEYLAGLDDCPACSEISRIEVIQGLRPPERQAAEALFAAIDWVALDEALARRAGELGQQWRRSHTGIGVADLTIAATAEQFDGGLATRNVRHFPMFANLRPPY